MSENNKAFSGGCLCGAVRYEVDGEIGFMGHCYCIDCRKTSGTAHGSHVSIPKAAVKITGEVSTYDRAADSGNIVSRSFCKICGSPVYSTNSGMPDFYFIRASSLDDLEIFKAQVTVYTSRAPSWGRIDPDVMSFEAMPPRIPGA